MESPPSHAAPTLARVMAPNPVTVDVATTLDQALALLERYGFRHLPVVEQNRVVGMISDRDLCLATGLLGSEQRLRDGLGGELQGPRLAGEILRQPVHCLTHEATVLEAARHMLRLRIGAIPVVERAGENILCGIVTETDLLRTFLELCRSGDSADAPARAHMRTPLPCVEPETGNEVALQRLDPEIRHLGVLRGTSLVGIVSERDLLLGLARTTIREARAPAGSRRMELPWRVERVMTTRLVTVAPDTPLSHCAGRMLDHRISALPVLEGERPLGIVTRGDLLAHLVSARGDSPEPELVKEHDTPAHGRITRLDPLQGSGYLTTADGREIYFHANSLLDGFEELEVGTEVRFHEEQGERGPQASSVQPVGRHGHRLP